MGATRMGKSYLSVDLATHFRGEIINSDKMQVYKGLDIVTNKITHAEKQGVSRKIDFGLERPFVPFEALDDICGIAQAILGVGSTFHRSNLQLEIPPSPLIQIRCFKRLTSREFRGESRGDLRNASVCAKILGISLVRYLGRFHGFHFEIQLWAPQSVLDRFWVRLEKYNFSVNILRNGEAMAFSVRLSMFRHLFIDLLEYGGLARFRMWLGIRTFRPPFGRSTLVDDIADLSRWSGPRANSGGDRATGGSATAAVDGRDRPATASTVAARISAMLRADTRPIGGIWPGPARPFDARGGYTRYGCSAAKRRSFTYGTFTVHRIGVLVESSRREKKKRKEEKIERIEAFVEILASCCRFSSWI
ncbi:hypothetical protein H5410_001651 [Solanum commersonii]|uniref:Uncharacterized protein n=1 Tax=Solanum commersonii TaxID=4109 RepID=A0A9J6AZL5_SOLCO|nr:hypothetical protein H5410_001651 [Solanum commersonii]